MTEITFKGQKIHTNGDLPKLGAKAPDFLLIDKELKERTLKDYKGKKKLLSTVISLDTSVCLSSAKKFNEKAASYPNLSILYISADLPFAQSRVCGAENLKQIETLSMMRNKNFGHDYGLLIQDGPLAGLLARSIIILDENDIVIYHELVPEITKEPNYEEALQAIS